MPEQDTSIPTVAVSSSHSSMVSLGLESPKRRCSTRLLSQSVQQTLRQMKREEHELRVANLVRKNKAFYKKQKVCESFTTFSILVSFSGDFGIT